MVVEIRGRNLPGRTCSPGPGTGPYENVHVGPGVGQTPTELVPGDAPSATWRIDVRLKRGADGSVDFGGRFVHGRRGDRFLYLNWGTVADDGSFELFRRAKLMLSDIDPSMLAKATRAKAAGDPDREPLIVCTVDLTDDCGNPRCARLRAPHIGWEVVPVDRE